MNKRRPSIDRHSAGKAGSDRQQACKEVEALLTLESNKYNEALVRGRHPRSFGKSGTIWDHLDKSEKRAHHVKMGQPLAGLRCEQDKGLKASSSAYSIKTIRKIANTKRLVVSQSLKTLHQVKRGNRKGSEVGAGLQNVQRSMEQVADDSGRNFVSVGMPVHFGSKVALELFDDEFLAVSAPNGDIGIKTFKECKGHSPHRMEFKLIDISEIQCAGQVRFGDSVWLQITNGNGDNWEHGSVLGVKVRVSPQLQTIPLNKGMKIRNPEHETEHVGVPVPITALMPKIREDGQDAGGDEIATRIRNKVPKNIGRWIIRPSIVQPDRSENGFVLNGDEIFLEQNWFYLSADNNSKDAILKQFATPQKPPGPGEYIVERRASFKLRLLESNGSGGGLNSSQMQMEKLLYKAKKQLVTSKKMRNGQKQYTSGLTGGTEFARQMRVQVQNIGTISDDAYFRQEEAKEQNIDTYFEKRFRKNVVVSCDPEIRPISPKKDHAVSPDHAATSSLKHSDSPDGSTKIPECNLCHASTSMFNLCAAHHAQASTQENTASEVSDVLLDTPMLHIKNTETASERKCAMVALMQREDDKLLGVLRFKERKLMYLQQMYLQQQAERNLKLANVASSEKSLSPITSARSSILEDLASAIDDSASEFDSDDDENNVVVKLTPSEIEALPYIDTEQALEIYENSQEALIEMLLGYREICENRIIPRLQLALTSKNKASIFENIDFLARSSEFVAAKKVQVIVIDVLLGVSTCNADHFSRIYPLFDRLIDAIQKTVQCIDQYCH